MANPLGGRDVRIDVYDLEHNYLNHRYLYYHKYMPPTLKIFVYKATQTYETGEFIYITYRNNIIKTIYLDDYGYGDYIICNPFENIPWTGVNGEIRIEISDPPSEYYEPYYSEVIEDRASLLESCEYVADKLANILTEKDINSKYDEGLTTLINKINQIDLGGYSPILDSNTEVVTLVDDYDFTCDDGYGGGLDQCGYVKDGFYNSSKNWELEVTIQPSYWGGGFCLFAYPYELQNCPSETNKWDCIFHNGQEDILMMLDGNLQQNKSNNTLSRVGITYNRSSTIDAKFVKNGTILSYYENGTLKGSFTWSKLATAKRIYLGILTWGNHTSKFTNVNLTRSA